MPLSLLLSDKSSRTAGASIIIFVCALFSNSLSIAGQDHIFSSGENRVSLIELYTSEGCSSCPPADFWLNNLIENENLWTQFIPLSFHVDYWDYLGWKDKYSNAEFSLRQRRYKSLGQVRSVYTPGMFLNGLEWRDWRRTNIETLEIEILETEGTNSIIGNLELRYLTDTITVEFTPTQGHEADRVYLALLGFDLNSSVKAGENMGRNFTHSFVVLELQSSEINLQGGKYQQIFNAFKSGLNEKRYGIAAWVTHEGDSKPLQATGGWITTEAR